MSAGAPGGRPPSELDDVELEQQGTQAHATRNWVFLHGTADQLDQHTRRMFALEQEYLRRHPHRTWQGTTTAPDPDPERAVLTAVATAGGRMHKLEVHQAARAVGLTRGSLAALYGRGLLVTEGPDRVLTAAGRELLSAAPAATTAGQTGSPSAPTDLRWVAEERPTWDADVRRVVGGAADGVFAIDHDDDEALTGDWWSARDDDGRVLGYGWMDVTWGEAEVLLAVDPAARGRGVGGWVLERLEAEAAARGLNYVLNTVRPTHPDRDAVHDWLADRGYSGSGPDAARRKRVGTVPLLPTSPAPVPGSGSDRGPGREDQGGYVDVEDHSY